MSDLVIKEFGGLATNYNANDISPNEFSDGRNFHIDGGALTKRNGCTRLIGDRLNGAVLGIKFLTHQSRPKPDWDNAGLAVDGELIICAGDSIYTGKW